MQRGISPDPNSEDEEYIKIEMIVSKKGVTQKDVIDSIKRCNIFGIGDDHINIDAIAITGIESVDKDTELDELMNTAITGAKSEIMQERLDQGQDIMTEMFFKKHPMWITVTNCPICGTPNTSFPCKRCGLK